MKIYKNPKKSISQKKKKEKTVDLDHMKTVLLIERFQEIRRKRLQKERKEREEQKKEMMQVNGILQYQKMKF